jgi:hypothetical protein
MAFVRRALEQLLNHEEPAWPLVQSWIAEATNPVEVLPPADDAGESLECVQITTRSPLGAIIYHTGGLLIDHGWLRLLGSGHSRLPRPLPAWNFSCGMAESNTSPAWLLVADDVLGGFFAMNGGRFSAEGHTIWYFAPDTLEWEDTNLGFTDFLIWCLSGELEQFYTPYRWPEWQAEVASLAGDKAFSIFPPLFLESLSIEQRSRRAVPVQELYELYVGEI